MPDEGDSLSKDKRGSPFSEDRSTATVNQKNEEIDREGCFSLAALREDQETAASAAADLLGGICDDERDHRATRRRQELPEDPNPALKLQRYARSDVFSDKQLVVQRTVDTLRVVLNRQDDGDSVLLLLSLLSRECDATVRLEIAEELPNIAVFCASQAGLLKIAVQEQVVSIIVQCLTDDIIQVRESAQVSLLFILERALIDRKQLEERVCRLVVRLRLEAVTLIKKMAPFLGQETAAAMFLPGFIRLCQDRPSTFARPVLHVLEIFSTFWDMCTQKNP